MTSQMLGFLIGVGNRWVLPRGITLGIDWIQWAQPVVTLKRKSDLIDYLQDAQTKKTLEDAFRVSMYCPRLQILKLSAGLSF